MKGLILKEFLYLRRQGKSVLIMFGFLIVMFLVMAEAGGKTGNIREAAAGIIVAVPVMLTVMLTINATAYDEQANWDTYVLSLPVSRNRVVASRYLSAALLSLAGSAVALLAGLLLLNGRSDPQGLLVMVSAAFACPLLLCSVLFPLFFRFGLQKARLAFAIIFLIPVFAGLLGKNADISVSGAQQVLLWELLPVFALIIVVVSFLISCAIYRRKEA